MFTGLKHSARKTSEEKCQRPLFCFAVWECNSYHGLNSINKMTFAQSASSDPDRFCQYGLGNEAEFRLAKFVCIFASVCAILRGLTYFLATMSTRNIDLLSRGSLFRVQHGSLSIGLSSKLLDASHSEIADH